MHIQENDNEQVAALGLERDLLWEALVDCPGVGVAVISASGVFAYANDEFRLLYFGTTTAHLEKHVMADLFPREWAEERSAFIARARAERSPVVVREIWRGRQLIATIKPIVDETGAVNSVMVISRPVSRDERPDLTCPLTESSYVELGPLNVLTARELTVLALVGQGLTLKQIAERLGRSFKTIDNHRASIGKKLRQTDRVALSIIAGRAGLVPGDESRTRVRVANSN